MPSLYAHYRFGKQAFASLPPEAKQCVQRFRRLYEMGQQGPDFFFYYNPLWKTPMGELGCAYHAQSGQDFFPKASNQATSEAARTYLYGLLGHYCLDSLCHVYMKRVAESGEARHVALESEFDRYLMAADKLPEPHTQDFSAKIKLTRGECVTVAGFYPPATPSAVNLGVHHMAMATRFLSGKKRDKHEKLVRRVKPAHLDHFIPREPVAAFARMDSELLARYNLALRQYPEMLRELMDHMKTGEPLGEDFTAAFG